MPKVDHSKCEHEHDGARYNSCGSCGKPLWEPDTDRKTVGFSRGVDYKTPIVFEKSQEHTTTTYSISMLRQWLNEDRITEPSKMVTNEMIERWLKLEPPTVVNK